MAPALNQRWYPLGILAGLGVLSFLIGILMPADTALVMIQKSGYWIILGIVGLFVLALVPIVVRGWTDHRTRLWREWRTPLGVLTLALLLGVFLMVRAQETAEYKIVIDEPVLQGTAWSMHHEREVAVPFQMHRIEGVPTVLERQVDKRPILFPFLVSLVHDLGGYSAENIFLTNAILSFIFLLLAVLLGKTLGGWAGAILSLFLWGSFPLWVRFANSGGFEVLNVTLILGTMLAGMLFWRKPDKQTLSLLCLTSVLLAYVRYESGLYLLPVGLLILLVFFREGRAWGSWGLYASPLALVPLLWHFNTFRADERNWQMWDFEGVSSPFGWQFVGDNLISWQTYFFSLSAHMPNSLVLSLAGLIGLVFFLIAMGQKWEAREREDGSWSSGEVVLGVFLIGFLANILLQLFYFYGQFDNILVRRLSLPLHLPLAFGLVWVVGRKIPQGRQRWMATGVLSVVALFLGLAKMGPATYSEGYLSGRGVNAVADLAAEWQEEGKRYLIVAEFPVVWIAGGFEATTKASVARNPNNLLFYLSFPGNPPVMVERRLTFDPVSGEWEEAGRQTFPEGFATEVVWENRLSAKRKQTVERVVGLKEAPMPGPPAGYASPEDFFERWERRLP
ncbi:MAG: glycosyltransferase family 39 protein [Opitutales bacterium]|nr:glycosyltransferase family 39 protein [Opitutales bacterium]